MKLNNIDRIFKNKLNVHYNGTIVKFSKPGTKCIFQVAGNIKPETKNARWHRSAIGRFLGFYAEA
jgi:hypothetical protein